MAIGGAIGATLRHTLSVIWPVEAGAFPWVTFVINVSGCLVMGLLKPVITELLVVQRWVSPFIGTGILGGYTTFSHYVTDVLHLSRAGRTDLAMIYMLGTMLGAIIAVSVGIFLAQLFIRSKR